MLFINKLLLVFLVAGQNVLGACQLRCQEDDDDDERAGENPVAEALRPKSPSSASDRPLVRESKMLLEMLTPLLDKTPFPSLPSVMLLQITM